MHPFTTKCIHYEVLAPIQSINSARFAALATLHAVCLAIARLLHSQRYSFVYYSQPALEQRLSENSLSDTGELSDSGYTVHNAVYHVRAWRCYVVVRRHRRGDFLTRLSSNPPSCI